MTASHQEEQRKKTVLMACPLGLQNDGHRTSWAFEPNLLKCIYDANFAGESPIGKPCITSRRPSARDSTGRYSALSEPHQIIGIVID
ncbi:MAG: hypothetical protein JWO48_3100 [Bryobacterales bacterium]|nr:hypothetical protein [Bryobacterales bacterium]